jgi:hypothetical protein
LQNSNFSKTVAIIVKEGYFRHFGLVSELLKVESFRFPTLFDVVQELQSGGDEYLDLCA